MTYETISKIIFKEVEALGYRVTERKSVSTNSVYYTLFSSKSQLMFRVSDHKTDKNIVTLRVDQKGVEKNAIHFIRNRIKDLQYRNLKAVLGM